VNWLTSQRFGNDGALLQLAFDASHSGALSTSAWTPGQATTCRQMVHYTAETQAPTRHPHRADSQGGMIPAAAEIAVVGE
jgi:hypothetical protein